MFLLIIQNLSDLNVIILFQKEIQKFILKIARYLHINRRNHWFWHFLITKMYFFEKLKTDRFKKSRFFKSFKIKRIIDLRTLLKISRAPRLRINIFGSIPGYDLWAHEFK